MMKFVRTVVLGLPLFFFVLAGLMPQPAQASWLDFFFPQLKEKGPDPSKTLQAPFADPDAVIEPGADKDGLGENSTPLNLRHRSNAVIAGWVEKAVSDLLSYDAQKYNAEYKVKSKLFDKEGLLEYVRFLQQQKVVAALKSGQYNVRDFVKDVPILLNEGDVAGRYRWLFQVSVMVSYMKTDMKSYKDDAADNQISKDYTIYVHVGRSPDAKNEHGILIEGWELKPS